MGLDAGVVDGDGLFQVAHCVRSEGAALGGQGGNLVLDVVAFDVDPLDGIAGDLVLPLALADGVLKVFHLLGKLSLFDGAPGQKQDDGTAGDREQIARLAERKEGGVLKLVFPADAQPGEVHILHRAEDCGDQQHHHRKGKHLPVQPAARGKPCHPAEKQPVKDQRHRHIKAVMEQSAVNVEGEAAAAEPEQFCGADHREIQFVAQVLGSIGHTAA